MTDMDFRTIGKGQVGGKGQGLLRLRELLQKWRETEDEDSPARHLSLPPTVLVSTEVFRDVVVHNKLEDACRHVEQNPESDSGSLRESMIAAELPAVWVEEFSALLGDMTAPLAIRSSSLLEDQKGAAFAGKYESVLIGNQGPLETRLEAFLRAVKQVFASTYGHDALNYRKKHGFLDVREEMALVVQEVVGRQFNNYFLPAMAGVGFSQNGYCWTDEIKRSDGLVRLVFGLGHAAVGRGYVRLFPPPKPSLRPEGTEVNGIQKCSQKKVWVIDLDTGELTSVHFRELIPDAYGCFPGAQYMVSLKDGEYLYQPVSSLWDSGHIPVLTMDGVLSRPWMKLDVPATLDWLLRNLEREMGSPIDLEFAIDHDDETSTGRVYLLQARPLSEREGEVVEIPEDIPEEDFLIHLKRNLPTAYVPDIEYIVIVDEDGYREWPYREKPTVARAVGSINARLKGSKFALVGPGRWGSWNPQLGVPVNYSEICNCCLLIEVARREGGLMPEVSFGSHFFQDLIEDGIAYLPVHPGEPAVDYREGFVEGDNKLAELVSSEIADSFGDLIRVIHLTESGQGKLAHAVLNGNRGEAAVFLK
jgi:hypothetical protein